MKRKIDRNYKTDYSPKSIMESLNWLPFIYVMDLTADKIENDINLFSSLLNVFKMFEIKCWWNKKRKR